MNAPVCPTPHKIKYETRKRARSEARRLRHHHESGRGRIQAYLCSCGSFHIGTLPPWVSAGRGTRGDLERPDAA